MVNDAVPPLGIERLAMRLGDLELRTCDESLTIKGTHCTAEIVKWEGSTCFTVAAWGRHKEGFDLRFAGSRPFIYADPMVFWQLAQVGDNHLREHLKRARNETNPPDGAASSHCSSSPAELDRETALRHKRGFEALRQSARDLADTSEMNTPGQVDRYLATVPADLRPTMRAIFDDIARLLRS